MLLPINISDTTLFTYHHDSLDEVIIQAGTILTTNRAMAVTINCSSKDQEFLIQKLGDANNIILITRDDDKQDPGSSLALACDLHKKTHLLVKYTTQSNTDYQELVAKCLSPIPQQQKEEVEVKVAKSLPLDIDSTTLFNCHHDSLDEATTHAANIVKANAKTAVTINGSFGDKKFVVQKLANADNIILITITEQNRDIFLPLSGDLHCKTRLFIRCTTRSNTDYQKIVAECLLR